MTLLAFKASGTSGNRRSVGSTPTHFRQNSFRAGFPLPTSLAKQGRDSFGLILVSVKHRQ